VIRTSKPPSDPREAITPEPLYLRRRELIKNAALAAGTALGVGGAFSFLVGQGPPPDAPEAPSISGTGARGPYALDEATTSYEVVTTYNNYYEFGTDKGDPARNAHTLRPRPWTLRVEGEVSRPQTLDIETMLSWFTPEERIYRMRCVEAWSMVIPWLGFPLSDLITRLEPTGRAKYVELTTLADPQQMPGQRSRILPWPYVEGLRMDEAMHPLSFLAVGLYGKALPNQNGAPLRLVVPWKYGFKGVKSIVQIRFTETQPRTTWALAAPNEYGFYANVNPSVDHPRWSQATERRLGEFFRRPTLPFNGYADQVAGLYAGMDLRTSF